jgi:hemolysin D
MNSLGSWRDLCRRYAQVFKAAWVSRKELDVIPRRRDESEFLPTTLALRDTPVHPAPRVAMWLIIGLLVMTVGWASFGKVDVVAMAPGKLIPSGNVKTIQPQDTAVVTAIHVKDGQSVKQGDPLIDFDATDATADAAHAQSDLRAIRSEIARAQAMLDAINHNHEPKPLANFRQEDSEALSEQHTLDGEYADYLSNISKMQADIQQSKASLRETDDEIHKLADTLPIEQRKERDYAELAAKGFVGKHDYYNEQQAVIQLTRDLELQRSKRLEIQAVLESSLRKREAYVAEVRRTWLEKIHDDTQKADGLAQDLAKANQRQRLMRLTAPVDGTVQHLAVHTLGGVVTPAQTLMTLVPADRVLQVEAIVDNQDIGFISVGQHVEVKVETFPFTRYGTLSGTVVQVSNDAKQDDKLGLIFTAEVALARDTMRIDNRLIRLTPGMAVTAEIKTGRRRIISYLLSPLIQHANESLHER